MAPGYEAGLQTTRSRYSVFQWTFFNICVATHYKLKSCMTNIVFKEMPTMRNSLGPERTDGQWAIGTCWVCNLNMSDVNITRGTYSLHSNPSVSCSCRWGETTSLNCGHQWAYSSTTIYIGIVNRSGTILTRETEELGDEPVPVPYRPQ
jgi:hypothetical protein